MVLDEKTERIATLEKEILMKEEQLIGSEQQIHDLQHKNQWVSYVFIKFDTFQKILSAFRNLITIF